jgi:drug/metabolite transporter (DMT)-like permease
MLTTAAESGIITGTTPAAGGALSFLVLGERLTRNKVVGIALAVLGILAVNVAGTVTGARRGPNRLLGNLLIIGSVLGEASFAICGKADSGRVRPLTISAAVTVLVLLTFLPFAAHEATARSPAARGGM